MFFLHYFTEWGSLDCFSEVDAATNSGKEDVKRILEEIQYNTFSGKKHLYILDEAHELSKAALTALLKSMEDCVPGSEHKQLVCIFCTTEPEKMAPAVFSRCAPAFAIRPTSPSVITKRLEHVCSQEDIAFEVPALQLIAEYTQSHIRDALKALESVSALGEVTENSVRDTLGVDLVYSYYEILACLGSDLPTALKSLQKLSEKVAPSTVYSGLIEAAMLSYQVFLGVSACPSYLRVDGVKQVGETLKEKALVVTSLLSKRPYHVTYAMLSCDLSLLHLELSGQRPLPAVTVNPGPPAPRREPLLNVGEFVKNESSPGKVETGSPTKLEDPPPQTSSVSREDISSLLLGMDRDKLLPLKPEVFKSLLQRHVLELYLGSSRGQS